MRIIYLITLLIVVNNLLAQEKQTANTLKLSAGAKRDKAKITDLKWLSGHWIGNALGGVSEEVWTPPMAGSMMGSYRLVTGDTAVVFYEILSIIEDDGSLTMRLKHFNKDLTGWEEKKEVREFKLIKLEPDKAYFEGMTLHHTGDDTLQVYLAINKKDGTVTEEIFHYKRRSKLNGL